MGSTSVYRLPREEGGAIEGHEKENGKIELLAGYDESDGCEGGSIEFEVLVGRNERKERQGERVTTKDNVAGCLII